MQFRFSHVNYNCFATPFLCEKSPLRLASLTPLAVWQSVGVEKRLSSRRVESPKKTEVEETIERVRENCETEDETSGRYWRVISALD